MATLNDLTDAQLKQLATSFDSGTYSDADYKIINTLDDATLKQLADQHDEMTAQQAPEQQAPQGNPNAGLLEKGADYINAGVSGVRQGVMDGVGSIADLAANIMSKAVGAIDSDAGKTISEIRAKGQEYGNKFKDYVNQGDVGAAARKEHPEVGALGATLGSVGSSVMGGNAIAKPVTAGLGLLAPAASRMLPGSLQGNVAKGMLGQGVLGSAMGAIGDPDHPVQGAITGGAVGATIGAAGGYLGGRLTKAGKIVAAKDEQIAQAKLNPLSEDAKDGVKEELDSFGAAVRKLNAEKEYSAKVDAIMAPIRPAIVSEVGPAQTIVDNAALRFKDVQAQKSQLYAPLDAATGTLQASNAQAALQGAPKQVQKYLPSSDVAAPVIAGEATWNQMQQYRQTLDKQLGKIDAAIRNKNAIGVTDQTLEQLQNVRKGITADMEAVAAKQGLAGQGKAADEFYKSHVLPFQVFNTQTGKMTTPEELEKARQVVQKLITARPTKTDINALRMAAGALGPDGQKQVGYAMLQNAVNLAKEADQDFSSAALLKQLAKFTRPGIDKLFFTKEVNEVKAGLVSLLDGSTKMISGMKPQDSKGQMGNINKAIQSMFHSQVAVDFLRWIGGATGEKKRKAIQDFVTGLGVHEVQESQKQQP